MATYPNMNEGEGLTRTYDLYKCLISDVENSFEYWAKNKSSQFLKRNVTRTIFSFIEGIIQILKFEIKADIRFDRIEKALSEKESEIIHNVRFVKGENIPWNIPIEINLKSTITISKKVWNLCDISFDFSSHNYASFLSAKRTRNKLTHPITYYDIQITNDEIELMESTYQWVKSGFVSLLEEKIRIIRETLPDDLNNRFRVECLKLYCC